jgi:hypothetical protein
MAEMARARFYSSPGRKAVIGLLLVVGGLVLAFFGLNRAFVTEIGRPWDITYERRGEGPISGTIAHEDGRVETFGVEDEEELRAFLDRRERELTDEYNLGVTALIGKVMLFGGLASAIVGVVALVWALIAAVCRA